MQQWIFLSIAIVSEVIATTSLKAAEGFTHVWPSCLVVVGYAIAFYFLSLTLKTIPVGVVYAIWSGAGIAIITLVAWLIYGQTLNAPSIVGVLFIVVGIIVLNVYSGAA